jgi:hypothetical protein
MAILRHKSQGNSNIFETSVSGGQNQSEEQLTGRTGTAGPERHNRHRNISIGVNLLVAKFIINYPCEESWRVAGPVTPKLRSRQNASGARSGNHCPPVTG